MIWFKWIIQMNDITFFNVNLYRQIIKIKLGPCLIYLLSLIVLWCFQDLTSPSLFFFFQNSFLCEKYKAHVASLQCCCREWCPVSLFQKIQFFKSTLQIYIYVRIHIYLSIYISLHIIFSIVWQRAT